MGRRTLVLVASVLLSAVGVSLIALYVRGADQRATRAAESRYGPPPPTPTLPPSPTPSAGHPDIAHLGISVAVADPDRSWALLGPGDLVSIWSTTEAGNATQVLSSVKVIAIGSRRSVQGVTDPTIPGAVITLDADVEQTEKILEGQSRGTLSIAILGRSPTGTGSS